MTQKLLIVENITHVILEIEPGSPHAMHVLQSVEFFLQMKMLTFNNTAFFLPNEELEKIIILL